MTDQISVSVEANSNIMTECRNGSVLRNKYVVLDKNMSYVPTAFIILSQFTVSVKYLRPSKNFFDIITNFRSVKKEFCSNL